MPAQLLIVRFASCFFMFHMLDSESSQDERKQIHDSILLVFLTLQATVSTNSRIDIIFTMPFGIVSNSIIMRLSLQDEGDNMACFVQPDKYTNFQVIQWTCIILCCVYGWHSGKRKHLESFLQQNQSQHQQECLQKIFDQQQDGMIILQRAPMPNKQNQNHTVAKKEEKLEKDKAEDDSSNSSSSASCSSRNQYEIGSSFASFVNPTEQDEDYDVVFQNSALLRILGLERLKTAHEKQEFIHSQLFTDLHSQLKLSLKKIAENRYSYDVLSQVFSYESQLFHNRRLIFQRNEIIYNGKSSVLINLRDITEVDHDQSHQLINLKNYNLEQPFESLKSSMKVMAQSCEILKKSAAKSDTVYDICDATQLMRFKIRGNMTLAKSLQRQPGLVDVPRIKISRFSLLNLAYQLLELLKHSLSREDKIINVKVDISLKDVSSDQDKLAFLIISLFETALEDPLRESKIYVVIERTSTALPNEVNYIFGESRGPLNELLTISVSYARKSTNDDFISRSNIMQIGKVICNSLNGDFDSSPSNTDPLNMIRL